VVGRIEHHVRQPALEAGVVAELLEQFSVVGQQLQHHAVKRLVVLQFGVLLVGVRLRILISLVLRHTRRDILGDDLADLVLVLPLDVAEQIVESLDDRRELVDICLIRATTAPRRYRIDRGIGIGHSHLQGRFGLHPVAVHVDGL